MRTSTLMVAGMLVAGFGYVVGLAIGSEIDTHEPVLAPVVRTNTTNPCYADVVAYLTCLLESPQR